MKIKSTVLLISILWSGVASANFSGNVIDVMDGGRVVVSTGDKNVVVKLRSIVTPFPNQVLYAQSRQVFERIMMHRPVTVVTDNTNEDVCIEGELISHGVNLNEALLMTGFAWIFNQETATESYRQIEGYNQAAGVGLWKPEYHFKFSDIALTPNMLVASCITKGVHNVPLEDQPFFAADSSKYNFFATIKCIAIGVILGLLLWFGIHKFDEAGFDLLKPFRKKKKKEDDEVELLIHGEDSLRSSDDIKFGG